MFVLYQAHSNVRDCYPSPPLRLSLPLFSAAIGVALLLLSLSAAGFVPLLHLWAAISSVGNNRTTGTGSRLSLASWPSEMSRDDHSNALQPPQRLQHQRPPQVQEQQPEPEPDLPLPRQLQVSVQLDAARIAIAYATSVHDAAAGAQGVEVRYPFLDPEIVQVCVGEGGGER